MSRFQQFVDLHQRGRPLILFNVWDAGSARAVAAAGASAIGTGSWSVAAAHGYGDGEDLPLDLALANAERIVGAVDLPVTIDFEGGYAEAPEGVAANAARLAATGAIGCNLEDRVVAGDTLYSPADQSARIAALRRGAGPAFFINARTDLFLKAEAKDHAGIVDEAIARAAVYAGAGANGLFVPSLVEADLIGAICAASPVPVNVMTFPGVPDTATLAGQGVARISHGPGPYRAAMQALQEAAAAHYGG